jgi:hypothetical protein
LHNTQLLLANEGVDVGERLCEQECEGTPCPSVPHNDGIAVSQATQPTAAQRHQSCHIKLAVHTASSPFTKPPHICTTAASVAARTVSGSVVTRSTEVVFSMALRIFFCLP